MLRPDELHLITKKRLADDKAALIIARTTNSSTHDAPPKAIIISGVSTVANSKVMPLLKSEKSTATGWGAALVKPGRYGDLALSMTIRTKNVNGRLVSTPVPSGSAEEVLRAREQTPTITVKSGEVIYIGTRVWDRKRGSEFSTYRVLNQEKAARAWLGAHAPSLARSMTVRLYPIPAKRRKSPTAETTTIQVKKRSN